MTTALDAKLDQLRGIFSPMPSVIVAFSGGVDSTFVLKVAHDTIGDRVLALTTTSPTMPDEDRQSALAMAQHVGARHLVLESNELEIPATHRTRSIDATCASTISSPFAKRRPPNSASMKSLMASTSTI